MRNLVNGFFPMLILSFVLLSSFSNNKSVETEKGINWMTIEEVELAQKDDPRKVLVDIYTTWCGPCKMMDKNTFGNQDIIDYMNANYYAVKIDAESRDEVSLKNKTYQFNKTMGRNGIHDIVFALTSGNFRGYPTLSFLDEDLNVMWARSGYFQVDDLMGKLKYYESIK